MTTITVANLKGGTGKTTTSILLAEALRRKGYSPTILDADPQGSATDWAALAAEDNCPLGFSVQPANLQSIRRHSDKNGITIIDCPPMDSTIITAAINAAQLVIIPVSPSGIEVTRMWDLIEIVQQAEQNYGVLITSADLRSKSYTELKTALENEGAALYRNIICARQGVKKLWGTNPQGDLFGYQYVAEEILGQS